MLLKLGQTKETQVCWFGYKRIFPLKIIKKKSKTTLIYIMSKQFFKYQFFFVVKTKNTSFFLKKKNAHCILLRLHVVFHRVRYCYVLS